MTIEGLERVRAGAPCGVGDARNDAIEITEDLTVGDAQQMPTELLERN